MRRDWEPEDLIACWRLVEDDWLLLANKRGHSRLAFALFLRNSAEQFGRSSRAKYLTSPQLRHEIHEGLQIVELWDSGNTVLFYGKDAELTGADREHQEVSMLALRLLQSALVHVNTLLVQRVLADADCRDRLSSDVRRGLTPLFWSHVNPYGRFRLDMEAHLDLGAVA